MKRKNVWPCMMVLGVSVGLFYVGEGHEVQAATPKIQYQTHVQNIGWQNWRSEGDMAGTSGKSLRMEAANIKLSPEINGGITYQTHVQNIGWQNWVANGATAGTTGRSLRLEAVKIDLTGEAKEKYDVIYRVHVQNKGWMAWVKNGAEAGTTGQSLRMEAVEIKLVEKTESPLPEQPVQPPVEPEKPVTPPTEPEKPSREYAIGEKVILAVFSTKEEADAHLSKILVSETKAWKSKGYKVEIGWYGALSEYNVYAEIVGYL